MSNVSWANLAGTGYCRQLKNAYISERPLDCEPVWAKGYFFPAFLFDAFNGFIFCSSTEAFFTWDDMEQAPFCHLWAG